MNGCIFTNYFILTRHILPVIQSISLAKYSRNESNTDIHTYDHNHTQNIYYNDRPFHVAPRQMSLQFRKCLCCTVVWVSNWTY